jgi:hypothetical protein
MSQVLKAKASGSIEPYKSDSHLEKRWRIAVLAIFVATFQPIMLRLRPPNGWQLKGETNKRLNESFKSSLCVVLRAIRLIVVESPYWMGRAANHCLRIKVVVSSGKTVINAVWVLMTASFVLIRPIWIMWLVVSVGFSKRYQALNITQRQIVK